MIFMAKIGLPKAWVLKVVARKRIQIADRFILLLQDDNPTNTCLEIGGPNFTATDILTTRFRSYIILNTNRKELTNPSLNCNFVPIQGDGCLLPFADASIDFIFCNAVIEHVPKAKRPMLAQEIQRVCSKGFFISTPYYWFPFEPHYHLPFIQYLPETIRQFVLRFSTIGFVKRHSSQYIRLLTSQELKSLFPQATGGGIRTALIPEIIYVSYLKKSGEEN